MIICSNCGGDYHGVNPCPPHVKIVKLLLTEGEARAVLGGLDLLLRTANVHVGMSEKEISIMRDVKRKLANGLNVPGEREA